MPSEPRQAGHACRVERPHDGTNEWIRFVVAGCNVVSDGTLSKVQLSGELAIGEAASPFRQTGPATVGGDEELRPI